MWTRLPEKLRCAADIVQEFRNNFPRQNSLVYWPRVHLIVDVLRKPRICHFCKLVLTWFSKTSSMFVKKHATAISAKGTYVILEEIVGVLRKPRMCHVLKMAHTLFSKNTDDLVVWYLKSDGKLNLSRNRTTLFPVLINYDLKGRHWISTKLLQ